jgi:hypothetical protein
MRSRLEEASEGMGIVAFLALYGLTGYGVDEWVIGGVIGIWFVSLYKRNGGENVKTT